MSALFACAVGDSWAESGFLELHTPNQQHMAVPEAIVEATEKGMVGENLLCGGAAVAAVEEKSVHEETGAKREVLSRAEEAGKTTVRRGAELDGHVKVKGVDV